MLVDEPADPFARVRAWRRAGHRVGVVVWLPRVPDPEDRAGLEPLVIVRDDADPVEVVARLEGAAGRGRLALRGGVVDLDQAVFRPHGDGAATPLTAQESDLLAYLAARPGRGVPRDELQRQVWGHKRASNTRAVDMAVSRLRKKIERNPAKPEHLITRRGDGYRLQLHDEPGPVATSRAPLFGRDALVQDVRRWVAGSDRLLTLVGPPGAGKTAVAEVALDAVGLRVFGCDLVPVSDEVGVMVRLASALGLDTGAGADLAAVRAHIGRALAAVGRCVVFLDNCEHLVDAVAAAIAGWSQAAPAVTFVVTSQARLALMHERVIDVPPLDEDAAVALLRDRCARQGVAVAHDDPDLRGLVALLDGLPLALDLAGARVRSMGVAGVREALQGDLAVLRDRSRDRAVRHASLEGALALAWARLDGPARSTLAQLSPFRAAFGLADAREVVRLSTDDVADQLEALVEQSLVQARDGQFVVLAPVRAFILGVSRAEEAAAATGRHVGWAARRGRALARATFREDGPRALRSLAALAGDLEAAFEWAELNHMNAPLVDVAVALDRLQLLRGDLHTRQRQLDRSVALVNAADYRAGLVELLRLRARVSQERGDLPAAVADLDRSVALAIELDLTDPLGQALAARADLLRTSGDLDAAHRCLTQALDAIGEPETAFHGLFRAKLLHLDHYRDPHARQPTAVAEMTRIVRRLESSGEIWMAAQVQFMLATVLHNAGDPATLRRARLHLLELHRRSAMRRNEGVVLCHVGLGLIQEERFAEAEAPMVEAVQLLERSNQVVRALHVSYFRALTRLHLGRGSEALDDFLAQKAAFATLDMRRAEAHTAEGIALVHLDRGDLAAARGALHVARQRAEGSRDEIMRTDITTYQALLALLDGEPHKAAALLDACDLDSLPADHAIVALGVSAAAAHRAESDPSGPLSRVDALLGRPEGIAYAVSLTAWRRAVADDDQPRLAELSVRGALPARLLARAWLVPPVE